MKRLVEVVGGSVLAAALGGCLGNQLIKTYEFYPPEKDTLTRREDGYVCGAIKSETIKSGSRDEGDKALALGLVNSL